MSDLKKKFTEITISDLNKIKIYNEENSENKQIISYADDGIVLIKNFELKYVSLSDKKHMYLFELCMDDKKTKKAKKLFSKLDELFINRLSGISSRIFDNKYKPENIKEKLWIKTENEGKILLLLKMNKTKKKRYKEITTKIIDSNGFAIHGINLKNFNDNFKDTTFLADLILDKILIDGDAYIIMIPYQLKILIEKSKISEEKKEIYELNNDSDFDNY
jgi:hypothetical protein